jgi:hypothetical protein
MVVFTPNDSENECCDDEAIPAFFSMNYEHDHDAHIIAEYETTYGSDQGTYTITITIERDLDDRCYWHIVVDLLDADTGYTTNVEDVEYTIDHDPTHCLGVPDITPISVTNYRGCEGTLTLRNVERAKLPYVKRVIDTCETADCEYGEVADLECVKVAEANVTSTVHEKQEEQNYHRSGIWWKGGTAGGYPYFLSPDGVKKLYHNGTRWVITYKASGEVYANGPAEECPFGKTTWARVTDSNDIICVIRWDEGNFIDLSHTKPCGADEAAEVAALTAVAVNGVVWPTGGTENGYPYFQDDNSFYKLYWDLTGWEIEDVALSETIAYLAEGTICPFGVWSNNWVVSRDTERSWACGSCTDVCGILTFEGIRRLDESERIRREFDWFWGDLQLPPEGSDDPDPWNATELPLASIRVNFVRWGMDEDINGQPSWTHGETEGACTEDSATTFERCLVDSYGRNWIMQDCDSDDALIDGKPCWGYAESSIRWSENYQAWHLYNGAGTLIATNAAYAADCPQGEWTLEAGGTFTLYGWFDMTLYWNESNWVIGKVGDTAIATGSDQVNCAVGWYVGTYAAYHVMDVSYCERGWQYYDPIVKRWDRLLLESTMCGQCKIETDFETGDAENEYYPGKIIDMDQGCACGLYETHWVIVGLVGMGFTVRCGRKQCWEWYCGTCRCVPKEVCALIVLNNVYWEEILTWDADNFCWGTYGNSVIAGLGRDPDEDADDISGRSPACQITLSTPGLEGSFDLEPVSYSCARETITKEFDPTYDFFSASFSDGENGLYVWIMGPSEQCYAYPCAATPCNDNCQGDPGALTVVFRWWTELDDMSPPPDYSNVFDITLEVPVVWYQYMYDPSLITFKCSYIGIATLPCPDPDGNVQWIEVRYGQDAEEGPSLSIRHYFTSGGKSHQIGYIYPFYQPTSCDPYFAQSIDYGSGGLGYDPLPVGWGSCDFSLFAYHFQITIME